MANGIKGMAGAMRGMMNGGRRQNMAGAMRGMQGMMGGVGQADMARMMRGMQGFAGGTRGRPAQPLGRLRGVMGNLGRR